MRDEITRLDEMFAEAVVSNATVEALWPTILSVIKASREVDVVSPLNYYEDEQEACFKNMATLEEANDKLDILINERYYLSFDERYLALCRKAPYGTKITWSEADTHFDNICAPGIEITKTLERYKENSAFFDARDSEGNVIERFIVKFVPDKGNQNVI